MTDAARKSLGDYVHVKHGFAFKGEYFTDDPKPEVLVTPGNFAIGGGFQDEKLKYYAGPVPDEYVLEQGDLVITMTDLSKAGDTLGYPALIPKSTGRRYLHNQRVGLVQIHDEEQVDKRFLYYRLCASDYRHHILATASGSTVRHTSPGRIGQFETTPPAIDEQRAIAVVLGALDAKIEQNRQTEQALERLARAIFRAWFVDFEPVKAKAAGATAFPSMPQRVFDALPTRFVDSDIGPVPERWEVKSFGDVLVLQYGKAMKADDRQPGPIPVYGSNGQVGWHIEAIAAGPGIIVGRKGNPGTVKWSQGPFFPIDTTFFVQLANGGASIPLLFHQLQAADLSRLAADSAVPGVNRNMIYGERCVVPRDMTLAAFDELVLGLWELQTQLMHECNTLVAMRDYLLPKLLNGDVRVGSSPQKGRT